MRRAARRKRGRHHRRGESVLEALRDKVLRQQERDKRRSTILMGLAKQRKSLFQNPTGTWTNTVLLGIGKEYKRKRKSVLMSSSSSRVSVSKTVRASEKKYHDDKEDEESDVHTQTHIQTQIKPLIISVTLTKKRFSTRDCCCVCFV